jgi:hypothetical protein
MSTVSFPYFSQLPLELRRMIWMQCLPHRIAEEDTPDCFFSGYRSNQACDARHTTRQNAQPPTIAFVNSESRQVVLEQGRILESVEGNDLKWLWVQPRRDILHLNWTRMLYAIQGVDYDATGPTVEFLLHATDLGMRPSVVAELIHPFNLKAVLYDADGSDASDSAEPFDYYGNPNIPEATYHYKKPDDVRDIVDMLTWGKSQITLHVALAGVSLHITREAALSSGLFGLLGDAPVQMVDVDDEARLRGFQALFREHALEKEPAAQVLFESFTSPRFKTAVEEWKRKAEWSILARMWQLAREEELDILGTNPGSAWLPQLPEQKYFTMSQYLLDEANPWVKQARQIAPKLRLQIMVQYCTNECYIKERLPKGFGWPFCK